MQSSPLLLNLVSLPSTALWVDRSWAREIGYLWTTPHGEVANLASAPDSRVNHSLVDIWSADEIRLVGEVCCLACSRYSPAARRRCGGRTLFDAILQIRRRASPRLQIVTVSYEVLAPPFTNTKQFREPGGGFCKCGSCSRVVAGDGPVSGPLLHGVHPRRLRMHSDATAIAHSSMHAERSKCDQGTGGTSSQPPAPDR